MFMYVTALDYAKAACDTMMGRFAASDLPPKGHFHYHQGVFLSGVHQTWRLCQEEKYFRYIKDWVDSIIDENGEIHDFDEGQLDDIQPGILLYPLYERTGDNRYKKALDTLLPIIKNFPRNREGGFWHKRWYPHQMWLDGLYMAGPIAAEYASRFDKKEYMDESHPMYEKLKEIVCALLKAVCRYQSEDGRWYQVVDKGGQEGNWLETSCTCLFVAAICKAVKKDF